MIKKQGASIPLLTAALLLISGSVHSTDVNITITAEITIPPCVVNGGSPISVDFGSMEVTKVDGQFYAKSTTVPVSCTYYNGTAHVKVTGTPLPGAPDNVLQTDATGTNGASLGVALYQGSSVNSSYPLRLGGGSEGKGYPLTQGWTGDGSAASTFSLTAVPYKQGSDSLEAGPFIATATMSITYL